MSSRYNLLPAARRRARGVRRRPRVDAPRLGVAFAAFAVFLGFGEAVRRGHTREFNDGARRRVRPRTRRRIERAADAFCEAGKPNIHPALATAVALAASRELGLDAARIPLASVATIGLEKAIRQVVLQRRPPGAKPHSGEHKYGFPSGHTSAITAIALTSALELGDRMRPPARAALWTAAVLAPVVMGAARLYMDEHWADDVIGGWLLGAAVACAVTGVAPDAAHG